LAQYLAVAGAVGLTTGAAFLFTPIVGAHATALVFLLTVVVISLFVDRGPALFAAALSALSWDYFFLAPVFAFEIHNFEDDMLFAMYFIVALALGQLTTRIKRQQEQEKERETRATALYLLTRELSEARTLEEILARATTQIEATFQPSAKIVLRVAPNQMAPTVPAVEQPLLRAPLSNGVETLDVVILNPEGFPGVSSPQRLLLESFAQQIALALDRLRLRELSERTRLLTESERLSKTLLDSMSHELRTPIAAIKSATETLLELRKPGSSDLQDQMIAEIGEATERLDHVVGNALELNRLESGAVKPIMNECDPAELVHLCCAELEGRLARHRLTVNVASNLPIMKMDFVLTRSAVSNLLANAAAHTPLGTPVEVSARVEGSRLLITVADKGPGIDGHVLPRIFGKFVRAPNAPVGGAGLGLSLVKGFIEAQGGSVSGHNQPGGGALFTILLPLRREPEASVTPNKLPS
jgi:two-component system sensor histidine kinase KdpD